MKKITLKNKIDFAFFVILIIFTFLAYFTYNRAQSVKQNRLIVNHTSNVNGVLEKVLSSTMDIETGTRGYTITGNENYLEVYNEGHRNLKIWLDSLNSMNENDEIQVMNLDTLQRLIESKKKISAETILVRRKEGMERAAAIVSSGRGKEIMDSIRNSIQEYQNQSVRLLSANLAETEKNIKARNLNFLLFTIITFIIVFIAYYKIRQNTKYLLLDKIIQTNLLNELAVQNTQLNDFANITSHNLRSPAGNITALISTIDDESAIEEYKTVFEMLKKVAQNLNDSLNQLIEVLHVKKNKIIEKESLNFYEIYSKTIESLQGEILNSKAVISANFENAASLVYSRIYLESIFHNLISNAIKYKDEARLPEINIHTEIKNNKLLLHVKDNGLGIDLERYGDKIFGMHQVFHKHPNAKGIGLFMTKTQIESTNGKISVASEVNKGTTFTVEFSLEE